MKFITKATVGLGKNMKNYSEMSQTTQQAIANNATEFKFHEFSSFPRGIGYTVKYPNGYGASIVKNEASYGREKDLWELAVLKGDRLCYDTSITKDVIGWLRDEQVAKICSDIARIGEKDFSPKSQDGCGHSFNPAGFLKALISDDDDDDDDDDYDEYDDPCYDPYYYDDEYDKYDEEQE